MCVNVGGFGCGSWKRGDTRKEWNQGNKKPPNVSRAAFVMRLSSLHRLKDKQLFRTACIKFGNILDSQTSYPSYQIRDT
jgi:hypothetical protein